jgi:hypothetical protein
MHLVERNTLSQQGCGSAQRRAKRPASGFKALANRETKSGLLACPLPSAWRAVAASKTWSPHSSAPNVSLTLR